MEDFCFIRRRLTVLICRVDKESRTPHAGKQELLTLWAIGLELLVSKTVQQSPRGGTAVQSRHRFQEINEFSLNPLSTIEHFFCRLCCGANTRNIVGNKRVWSRRPVRRAKDEARVSCPGSSQYFRNLSSRIVPDNVGVSWRAT